MRATFRLLPSKTSPRAGRVVVTEVLSEWGVPASVVDDAVLMVSELVTNAVLHARSEEPLELELDYDKTLRISLSDGCADHPRAKVARAGDEGGRGIAILGTLATRWGVDDLDSGKRVWAELRPAG